jgi:hypothetical protein
MRINIYWYQLFELNLFLVQGMFDLDVLETIIRDAINIANGYVLQIT